MDTSQQNQHSVKLNLRGNVFLTNTGDFKRYPDSRLASLSHSDENYSMEKDEYFFDRNPVLFHFILDLYRDGYLHLPKDVCSEVIKQELRFWKIGKEVLSDCCIATYFKEDDDLQIYEELKEILQKYHRDNNILDENMSVSSCRQRLWYTLVNPSSSRVSKCYFAVILLGVLTSIMVYVLSSLETFRQPRSKDLDVIYNASNPKIRMYIRTTPHISIFVLDIISNTILLFDYILIVYASPTRLRVMSHWLYVFDLFAIISIYAVNICDRLNAFPVTGEDSLKIMSAFVGVVYCCRMVRILRLMGHTKGAAALYMTFASRMSIILFFVLGFIAVCLLSAAMVYHAELWADNSFPDILRAFWWATITLSTVGYGDTVPETAAGRFITVFVIIIGLMLIAIPFVIITSNYGNYYTCLDNLKKHLQPEKNTSKPEEKLFDLQNTEQEVPYSQ